MSDLCSLSCQTSSICYRHSIIDHRIKRYWSYTHHTAIPLTIIDGVVSLINCIKRRHTSMPRPTSVVHFWNASNPTILISVVPLSNLSEIPFNVCQTDTIFHADFLTLGIQNAVSRKKCHLGIIRNKSFVILLSIDSPRSSEFGDAILTIPFLNLSKVFEKLHRIT